MLDNLPEETTQLLIDLCTTTGPLVPTDPTAESATSPTAPKPTAPGPSYLSYLALNRGSVATTVVSSETAIPPSPSIKTVRADNASTSRRDPSFYDASIPSTPPPPTASSISRAGDGGPRSGTPVPASAFLAPPPPVKRLSPRIYFPHFVDHMGQFVVFLETVAIRRWRQSVEDQSPGQVGLYSSIASSDKETLDLGEEDAYVDKQDQVAVWNTLLELYLTLPGVGGRETDASGKKFDESVMRGKALRVLRSDSIPYDSTHALILCSTYRFTLGLVLLWEKMGMYEDVLRFWMDQHKEGGSGAGSSGASAKVIEHLMHYGAEHPHLYELVLRFLTSTPELLDRHREDLKGILEYIDEEGLMPPLSVIQVLSRNGVASVGLVKEWLVKKIKEGRNEIQNVRLIALKSFFLLLSVN